MENENMDYENEAMESEIVLSENEGGNSGVSTGVAVAIGAGLAFAATAVVKRAKKAWAKHKANKELRQPDEGDVVEPTDDQVMEVTK